MHRCSGQNIVCEDACINMYTVIHDVYLNIILYIYIDCTSGHEMTMAMTMTAGRQQDWPAGPLNFYPQTLESPS